MNNTTFRSCLPPETIPGVPSGVVITQAVIFTIINILSLGLNGFVLFAIIRFKVLQQRTFIIALQIIIAHFIASFTVLPTSVVSAIADRWFFGSIGCNILGVLHDLHLSVRYVFMLVLTLDRVFNVFFPFFYIRHGSKLALIMSLIAWLILFVRILLSIEGVLSCYAYVPILKACTGIGSCSSACNVYLATWITSVVVFTQISPFVLSIAMCIKGKLLNRRLSVNSGTSIMVAMTDDPPAVTSKRRPIRQWQQDSRAMTTVVILFVAFIVCTIPPFILYFIQFVIFSALGIFPPPAFSAVYMLVGSTLLYFQTVADPIVIMRNQDFRIAVRQFLPCTRQTIAFRD